MRDKSPAVVPLKKPEIAVPQIKAGEDTQKYVRDLMRSCFQIEEEASQIKSKYGKNTGKIAATATDLFALPKPIMTSTKPVKALSKEEKMVLAASS